VPQRALGARPHSSAVKLLFFLGLVPQDLCFDCLEAALERRYSNLIAGFEIPREAQLNGDVIALVGQSIEENVSLGFPMHRCHMRVPV